MTEFLTSIQRLAPMSEWASQDTTAVANNGGMFSSIFSNALEGVKETQTDLEEKQYLLATGQLDDVHTLSVAAAEAQLNVDLLVQLRNNALESYNELLRISI